MPRPDEDIAFPEYAPDLSPLGTEVSALISGVLPRADGYGPFKSFQDMTRSAPAACRGYFFARKSDGSIAIFYGTSTELYLLDNTTFTWSKVSKGGGPYSALTSTANWQFRQFNDFVIAVHVGVPPQKYSLSGGGNFADLGGSPPQAAYVAIVNRFVVLTGLQSASQRIQWSDLDDPQQWTAGTGLSDYQDLPDGGTIKGVTGGDYFGLVFSDDPIRSVTYAPGSAVTMQITKVAEQDPLYAPYSIIQAGDRSFYISAQGFKMYQAGGKSVAIGKERVDRFFFSDVDASNLQLVIAASDPTATRVYWAYKSKAGSAGLFDKVLCFDWAIGERGRWTLIPVSGYFLAALARPGLTLEALDAIAPTPLTVTGAADNGSGKVRLTLSALSNSDFSLGTVGNPSQNTCTVYGIVGTTEANVTAAYTIIDATHIDLPSVTFANAYVSGGQIGGSLDALPFSLDSISSAAVASLSAVSDDFRVGFFDGANIEAILETDEKDLKGTCVFVESIRPITDAAEAVVSLGGRFLPSEAVSYTDESEMSGDGVCGIYTETRYARARMRIPAGDTWTYAKSVQAVAVPAGDD